jgi:hypothetical protein
MAEISDEFMRENLAGSRGYTLVLLKAGPHYGSAGSDAVVWEHGRRNFELRAAGKLAIVAPVQDDSDLCGLGIFSTSAEETEVIMAGDPAVQAGLFTVEIHPIRSFPGDSLPS